jgi:phosphatidylglycerophosphatase C
MDLTSPLTITEQPVVLRPPLPEHLARPRGGTAVWDVDGTLVSGDTLLPFLHRFVSAAKLGRILAGSLAVQGGKSDRRGAAKAAMLQQVLGDREVAAVDLIARRYAAEDVMHRVRSDRLRRWQWHRAQGHHMVLASASLNLYLRHLGTLLGAHEVISTEMSTLNGRLTGRLATPNCRGTQKAIRVLEHLASRPASTVWAYANGTADRPLLALADVATRVRPYRVLPPPNGD